jgi:poly-gamma-glutamate synthesis protein (capsule biosynthesis protein)
MFGRAVGDLLASRSSPDLFAPDVRAAVREADLVVANLECCITQRDTRWSSPGKRFFFRAPPKAASVLAELGVHCVTLANNHVLDYGREALLDTLRHLEDAGIRFAGAGPDVARARAPVVLQSGAFRLAVVAVTDHPADYAAVPDGAGVAFADLRAGVPAWLIETLGAARAGADAVLLSPHWGPNLSLRPPRHVMAAANVLGRHATLIAGHSAHVFHGVAGNVLFDLGDLINDYASEAGTGRLVAGVVSKLRRELTGVVRDAATPRRSHAHPATERQHRDGFLRKQQTRLTMMLHMVRARALRSDLGLLFFVTVGRDGPQRVEALPVKLERCRTRLAAGQEAVIARRRFTSACAALGTQVVVEGDRCVINL